MRKALDLLLGIVTSVGGFLEIGSIATSAQAGRIRLLAPLGAAPRVVVGMVMVMTLVLAVVSIPLQLAAGGSG